MPPPPTSADSPFIGREAELSLLEDWYEDSGRLLTVVGPPGVGKSRLVQELALPEDHQRHWFSLAELDDAEQLLDALSSALSLSGPDELERLANALNAYGASLVVLDNVEHLLPEAASLIDQLVQATHEEIKVLCTSRQRLLAPGETVLELQGLALDSGEKNGAPHGESWSEAARCFIARARMTQASYQPSPADREAIESLTQSLDGIPLAIELAAGRVSLLPATEIHSRLHDHFELLAHGTSRDKRHRTMQAAVAWSWTLLSDREQQALELLSLAEQVNVEEAARLLDSDPIEALERLQGLRDASLIRPVLDGRQTALMPYEVVRSFTLDPNRLQSEAEERLRGGVKRFIALCNHLALDLVHRVIHHRNKAVLLDGQRAQPNLLRALAYLQAMESGKHRLRAPLPARDDTLCKQGQQISTALLMLSAYAPVPGLRELFPMIAHWSREDLEPAQRCILEVHLAYFARQRLGQSEMSLRLNQEVEARAEALDATRPEAAEVWNQLAMASINRAQPDDRLLTKALESSQASGCITQQAMATMLTGNRYYIKGDYCDAITQFEEAESLARQAGSDILSTKSMVNLALALGADSQLERSLATTRKAVVRAEETGILTSAAWSQKVLADSAFAAGALNLAIQSYRDCIGSLRRIGAMDAVAFAMHTLGRALLEDGDVEEATSVCKELAHYVQKANFDLHGDHLGYLQGLLALQAEQYGDAARHFGEAQKWVVSSQQSYGVEIESMALLAEGLSQPSPVLREKAHELQEKLPEASEARQLLVARLNLLTLLLAGPDEEREELLKELTRLVARCRTLRHWSVREALNRVVNWLSAEERRTLLQHAIDPEREVLLLDVRDGLLWGSRPPHGDWIDLSSRATLGGVVLALADASRKGEALGVYELADAAWPDETIAPEAAANRVYNAIATLRKKGFRDVIQKGDEGYELAAHAKYLDISALWPEIRLA